MTVAAPQSAGRLRRPATAAVLLGCAFAAWLGTMVLGLTRPVGLDRLGVFELFWGTALSLPFPIVGFIIALRQPGNPLAWLFLIAPTLAIGGIGPWEIIAHRSGDVPAVVGFVGDTMFFVGISLMASLFLVLFPSGRVPSRRWRWVVPTAVGGIVLLVLWSLGRACVTWTGLDVPDDVAGPSCADAVPPGWVRFGNPFGTESLGIAGVFDVLGAVGSGLVVLAFFAGVVSLIVRYRSAASVERAQLRWPLALFAVLAPLFLFLIVFDVFDRDADFLAQTLFFSATIGLPISIGFAITRYRLYDIDRLIKRTATYTIVGVVLAGGFALVVLVPVAVVGATEQGSQSWLVALATLVAFGLFDPVRRRAQAFVDRRFDRQRYDARLVLDGFGATLLNVTETASIRREFGLAVDRMLRPSTVSIWLSDERS